MLRGETFTNKIDNYKPIILGLFLSTQILEHAIGNIALSILGALSLFGFVVKKKINIDKSLLPILLYFLWGVVSILWTTSVSDTLSGIGKTIALLVIPLFVSQQSKITTSDLRKIFDIFAWSLIIYFAISLARALWFYSENYEISYFFYHDLVSLFKNNAIYISLFTSICLLVKINLPEKNNLDRIMILLLSVFLVLLASKNLIISTLTLVVISKVLFKSEIEISTKRTIIPLVVALSIALVIVFFENPVKQRFLDESSPNVESVWTQDDFSDFHFNGSNLRLFQWRVVYEMIENNQIGFLGLGLDNSHYLTKQYFSYYNVYKGYMPVNFHNQYLQTFGELGIIGLLLLLSLFFFLFRKSFNDKNILILVAGLLIFLSFFTESYLCRQKSIMLFSTLISIFLFCQSVKNK